MIKMLITATLLCTILGCENVRLESHTTQTVRIFNELIPPVVLFSKEESMWSYGVSLLDGDGVLHHFGNASTLANGIGDNYNVGDTLKFINQ